MNSPRLQDQLREFRRRRFFQVAAWYVVAAWVVIQVATSTFPYLGLPAWLITAVIVVAMVGFPIALTIAWAHERASLGTGATKIAQRRTTLVGVSALVVIALVGAGYWSMNARRSAAGDNAFASTTLSQLTFSPE